MDTKQKILITAFNQFLLKNYDNTSMADIAEEVGITKPALYYYFKNKEELYKEVVNLFIDEFSNMTKMTIANCANIEEVLRSFFYSLEELIFDEHAFIQVFIKKDIENYILKIYIFLFESILKFPESGKRVRSIYSEIENVLFKFIKNAQDNNEIRNDIDAKILAFELNALLEGIYIMYIINPEINLKEIGEKMFVNYWLRIKN